MTTETNDYRPLDLRSAFNAPASVLEDPQEMTLGDRVLHGLPFAFGAPEAALVLAGPGEARHVEVGETAKWLVFAHAVLETDLYEGGSIGEPVGGYRVRYADGSEVDVPLRQRFEIGPTPRKWLGHVTPLDWGQTPFLAVNDAEHELMDRVCGRYDEAGARLVEIEDPQSRVPYILPYRFYLWGWRNPHPERPIARVDVLGGERHTLIVGAITRSELEEEPLHRAVAREMLVHLESGEVDERVEVHVDRGYATHTYLVNRTSEENRLGVPGWGHTRAGSSVGYCRVAASDSATVTVTRAGEPIGSFRWEELVEHGSLRPSGELSVELPPADVSWVTGEVRDADTGEPIACRMRFESVDGIPFAPYGHHAHINSDGGTWNLDIGGDVRLGAATYAFVDGRFEGWLPDGPVVVEVSRGFTYRPIRRTIQVGPGSREFVLELQRAFDPLSRGYAGGDTHVHFVSTKGGELEGRAEDLQVVNLLQTQWGQLFTSTEEFSGRPEYSPGGGTVVFTGQENRTNMLGHINLLGLREPIMPWCTGGSEEAELGGGLETTLSRWADECRAQGGTVVLAHFPVPYGETAALLATGRLDAVETIGFDHYNMGEYYRYLNAGFRIPLAAGTDKMTAEVPIGMMRTYAAVDAPGSFDYWDWSRGIKRGDTMVSSGPLLWARLEGRSAGSTVSAGSGERLTLSVELETVFPVSEVEVIVNGEIAARIPVPDGALAHGFEHELAVDEDSWVAVRCFGSGEARHHDTWDRFVFAHTSPIYVTTGDEYRRFDEATLRNMLLIVDGARRHVVERARTGWAGSVTHRHGREDHLAYLVEPFDEATSALHERLNGAG